MRRRQGFTLIEILFVMVIILVLAAIGFPKMKGSYFKARMSAAGREVVGLLRMAQSSSVLMELPTRVVFSPNEDQYWMEVLDESGKPVDGKKTKSRYRRRGEEKPTLALGEEATSMHTLAQAVHFSAVYASAELTEKDELPCVVFYPDGSATPTTIVVQDDQEHAFNVEVYRTTGMVKVETGLPEKEPEKHTLFIGKGKRK